VLVEAGDLVQVDNATPTIPSLEKSGIRGIRGSVVPSSCTRCSPGVSKPCVGAASLTSEIVDRWKPRSGCLKLPHVIHCI
jgi:hypothetical protein